MEAAAWWLADHPPWRATTHINHVSVRHFFPAWLFLLDCFIQKKRSRSFELSENTYPVTHNVTSLKTSVIIFLCVNILEQGLNNEQLWLAEPKNDESIKKNATHSNIKE